MPTILYPPRAQFLRPQAIRSGMDLLMFAHKSHLAHADAALAERGLGRAHHRVLYFLSRRPGEPVGALLDTLGVTKQSLNRVARDLMREGLVEQRVGERDRRQRLLFLTEAGRELEQRLFDQLHENMTRACALAGEEAVRGYWCLMQHLMDDTTQERFRTFAAPGGR